MSDLRDFFQAGDVITIAGKYADGTQAPNEGPIDHTRPMKKWRVIEVNGKAVRLQPLNEDGTVDAFNNCVGDFRIVTER